MIADTSNDEATTTAPKPLFLVHRNGRSGYVDETGRIMIRLSFVAAQNFTEGLAAIHMGRQFPMRDPESLWGYIDATGKHVIPPSFQMPKMLRGEVDAHFSEGMAAGANGQKCGYINPTGEYTIDRIFDGCSAFREGLAIVQQGYNFGCINAKGELQISFQPHVLFGFKHGRAPILVDGKYGFVDSAGSMAVPPVWSGESVHPCAYGFFEGLAAVESESGVGFVDVTGEIAIPPRLS